MGGGDSWDSIAFFNYPNTNPPEITIAPILQEKTLESERSSNLSKATWQIRGVRDLTPEKDPLQ